VAVPDSDGWYFLVYLQSTRFGDGFGILNERRSAPELPADWCGDVLSRAVYTTFKIAREARWRILPAREHLISRFPTTIEIYHSKTHYNLDNPAIGEFGSAEDPNGRLRAVTKEEASEVGLLTGDYDQTMLGGELLMYLRRRVTVHRTERVGSSLNDVEGYLASDDDPTTAPSISRETPLCAYVKIPGNILPIERGERFEEPLQDALSRAGLGEVTGGGSQLDDPDEVGGPRVAFCGLDIDLYDVEAGLKLLLSELRRLGAPSGTVVLYELEGIEYEQAVPVS
jgi:hypothetical protein